MVITTKQANQIKMADSCVDAVGIANILTVGNGVTSQDAMGEFVDNSLDAEASEIDIYLSNDGCYFRDNGVGIEDISKINTLGYSDKKKKKEENEEEKKKKNQIGQWGAGLFAATHLLAKKHHIISKGCNTMTTYGSFKAYDHDRVGTYDPFALEFIYKIYNKGKGTHNVLENPRVDTDQRIEIMKEHLDKGTHIVLENPRVEINDQFIKDMKEHLSHAYCKSIQNGIVIKVNGERIEHIDFKYDSSEEDECIIFKLRLAPGCDDKIPRFDIETDNVVIKNKRLVIKRILTEENVKTQAIVNNSFKIDKGDYNNDSNVIAKIQISLPKKEHRGRGTGGTCVVMNDRTLNKMTNVRPHNTSNNYAEIYHSMRIKLVSNSDNFNNRANKGSTSQTLDKFIKVLGLYEALMWCIHQVYKPAKNKIIKEKKKMEKEIKVDTTDDEEVPATDDEEVPATDNEEVPVTDDENDDIEVEPETSTEPTPVDVRSYRRGPASKDEMLYQLTRVMNIINESDENHYPAALYNQLTKII